VKDQHLDPSSFASSARRACGNAGETVTDALRTALALAAVLAVSLEARVNGAQGARARRPRLPPPLARGDEPGRRGRSSVLPPHTKRGRRSTSGSDLTPPPARRRLVPSSSRARSADEALAKVRSARGLVSPLDEARLKAAEDDVGPLRHLKLQGYVQFQYRFESFNDQRRRPRERQPPARVRSNDVVANRTARRRTQPVPAPPHPPRTIYETDVLRCSSRPIFSSVRCPAATRADRAERGR